MIKKQQNLIILVLVAALIMSGAANAIAGLGSCLPKACCCTKAMNQQMRHGDQENTPVHCLPEKPAPCCKIEQDPPRTHMAISAVPEVTPHRSLIAPVTLDQQVTEHQIAPTISRLLDDGRPKAPLVPIYLQTQSILC